MSKKIVVPANFEPRKYQLPVLQAFDEGYKRILMRFHRRAGKDATCMAILAKALLQKVGLYFYIFPTYAQARKAIFEGRMANGVTFLSFIPEQLIVNKNANEMRIELSNGSILRFVGSDNIDSLVGSNPLGVIFSEFALQDPRGWDLIRPILTANGGWAVFQSTPRGKNHMYTLEQNVKYNPEWKIFELQTLWPHKENYSGLISAEQIQEERDTGMPEELIEQEYGVSYDVGNVGSYFSDQIKIAEESGRTGLWPHEAAFPVWTYWDLGVSDHTAIWFAQKIGPTIRFIDYLEDTGLSAIDYAEMLKDKGYIYDTHVLPHDGKNRGWQTALSNQRALEEALDNFGVSGHVETTARVSSKQLSINAARMKFSGYYFNTDNEQVAYALDLLKNYRRKFDKASGHYINQENHDHTSHCASAFMQEALSDDLVSSIGYQQEQNINVNSSFDVFNLRK